MKILCSKIKTTTKILSLSLIAIIMAAVIFLTNSGSVYFGYCYRLVPIYSVETSEKKVALTFDAAWGSDKTLKIVEILNKAGLKGTFFLVGFWMDKFEKETKAIADAGFDVGNHSRNHLNMPKLSQDEIKNEIEYVNDRAKELTGKTPVFFRAPFGDYDNKLMTAIESLNMVGVQWSIDSLDWKGLGAKQIYDRVVPKAKNGDIVLFHNNSEHILDALPMILTGLRAKGFRFVTLSEIVATSDFTVDNNGVQRKNA